MKKAHKSLVEWALGKNYKIDVWDGEEWALIHSDKPAEIYEAMVAGESAEIKIHDIDGKYVGWALVIVGWGMEPDETVADYAPAEGEIDEWFEEYQKSIGN